MTANLTRLRATIQDFRFEDLFIEELGWDQYRNRLEIMVDGETVTLNAFAQKRGMVAFTVAAIPEYKRRRKIEQQVAKAHRENIIIYTDQTQQIWQWVRRETGKPLANRERQFTRGQSGENIAQILSAIAFSLDEEDDLTIVDVTSRVRAAFDVERVTKRFYDRFKRQHDAFLAFIEGIPDEDFQRWYASVMLNRLMFIYFVQRKGFLDGDTDYLRSRLAQTEGNFYRDFLCPLFFEGFAKKEHPPAIRRLLGDVPYLNGGLFLQHQIEELYGDAIQIENEAFERLFDFFDEYRWHLDERPLRADNEINPDVLGYIFEKYINQKQMGAYYTKEDITEYISKNTVIPFLFDEARKAVKIAFEGEHTVWDLLRENPDRYIYPAVRHGYYEEVPRPEGEGFRVRALPHNIAAGLDDVSQRGDWNTLAPPEYGLPTEIWRETVARRRRYEEVRGKLERGEVRQINDLITLNLDIQQFAQDVIDFADSPDVIRAFWKALNRVTVLDPTCGSGAFLFAALNILEPLYEACLERMEAFLAEYDRSLTPQSPLPQQAEERGLEQRERWHISPEVRERMTQIARTLRKNATPSEDILWQALRNRQLDNRKFKRQVDIGAFVVDFYCAEERLVVEVDGAIHASQVEADRERQSLIESLGIRFVRVKADDVEQNLPAVLDTIRAAFSPPSPHEVREKESAFNSPSTHEVWERGPGGEGQKPGRKYSDFREVMARIREHPNRRYFILKSIIVQNLYGVDIMEEAVEIAKLRLFLKLVAQLDPPSPTAARGEGTGVRGIEPLPDIDFNIRAGNTLVGFATQDEVRRAMTTTSGGQGKLLFGEDQAALAEIERKAQDIDRLFGLFRQQQTELGGEVRPQDKAELKRRLGELEDELNRLLAGQYGVPLTPKSPLPQQVEERGLKPADAAPLSPRSSGRGGSGVSTPAGGEGAYAQWLHSHKPFHWFVEFYGVLKNGGFDVIIGNPPYLELRQIDYKLMHYKTESPVHSVCIERSLHLLSDNGCISMIVPLALVSTQRMQVVQQLLEEKRSVWYSNFAWRPAKLFDQVNRALTIFVVAPDKQPKTLSTNYQKWVSDTRDTIIPSMSYIEIPRGRSYFYAPKFGENIELKLFKKLMVADSTMGAFLASDNQNPVYYRTTGGLYWKVFTDFAPSFVVNGQKGHSSRETTLNLRDKSIVHAVVAALSSDLFWWWYTITSNLRDLNPADIQGFPIPKAALYDADLKRLGEQYLESMQANSTMLVRMQKQTGKTETQSFKVRLSKPIIDEIDRVLARHYGFTDEELDFIINYDIKYRMGDDLGGEDEEDE